MEFKVDEDEEPMKLWLEQCVVDFHKRMAVNHVDFRVLHVDKLRGVLLLAQFDCGCLSDRSHSASWRTRSKPS